MNYKTKTWSSLFYVSFMFRFNSGSDLQIWILHCLYSQSTNLQSTNNTIIIGYNNTQHSTPSCMTNTLLAISCNSNNFLLVAKDYSWTDTCCGWDATSGCLRFKVPWHSVTDSLTFLLTHRSWDSRELEEVKLTGSGICIMLCIYNSATHRLHVIGYKV